MTEQKGYIITDQYALYFITMTIVGWVDLFTRKECRDILVDSLLYCIEKKGLRVHAYVIMSSHVHMIVSARQESEGLSSIVRDFKKFTSKALLDWILKGTTESRKEWLELVFKYHAKYNKNNKTYQLWQRNNQPKLCLHPKFIRQKIEYIHQNPVVAGIVDNAEEYKYSSARNYLNDEGSLIDVDVIDFGVEQGYVMV